MTPVELVELQLEGYNARNVEKFCSAFSEDIKVYTLRDEKLLFQGMTAFRETYTSLFADSPNLNVKIKQRMVLGDFIIDHEEVTGRRGQDLKAVAIYKITDSKISHCWFAL